MKFEDFKLSKDLLKAIEALGITVPTMIQEKAINLVVEGKDVIGQSATGSGKTLAFGCGIVENVKRGKGLQALIMAPTRELAEQVRKNIKSLSKDLKVISIYGGVSINPQIQDLPRADVVVGTPGRLLDHMSRGTINLSRIKIIILDEADKMFDMGFYEDVEKIIKACPKDRQTMFFSATIDEQLKSLSHKYMKAPVIVTATKMVDPKKLKQVYYDVPRNMKIALLIHLLDKEKSGLVMVFCNSRRNVDFVVKNLKIHKIDAVAIHGGFSQNKRDKMLDLFKNKAEVLVCTDVAARGLHIDKVSHIYNYDIPNDSKDYVHRIGRTARAGEEGKVINLISDYDYDNFSRVFRDYDYNIEKLKKPFLEQVKIVKVQEERRTKTWGPQRRGSHSQGSHRPRHR